MSTINIYHLHRLLDSPKSLIAIRTWATDRFETIHSETTEYSTRSRRLFKLIGSLEAGSILVVKSLFNLAEPEMLPSVLGRVLERNIILISLEDQLTLDPRKKSGVLLAKTLKGIIEGNRLSNREQKKKTALIKQWMGIQIGRSRIDPRLHDEALNLIKAGHSSRKISKMMNGKISKTKICQIKRNLMKGQ